MSAKYGRPASTSPPEVILLWVSIFRQVHLQFPLDDRVPLRSPRRRSLAGNFVFGPGKTRQPPLLQIRQNLWLLIRPLVRIAAAAAAAAAIAAVARCRVFF